MKKSSSWLRPWGQQHVQQSTRVTEGGKQKRDKKQGVELPCSLETHDLKEYQKKKHTHTHATSKCWIFTMFAVKVANHIVLYRLV